MPTSQSAPRDPQDPSDAELIARILAGETHLFELLMRRNNQRVYRVVRAIVREEHEAEDVMQDAYVRAFEHLGSFGHRAQFATWVSRIAVHEALARVRRGRRQEPLDISMEEYAMPSEELSPEQRASDKQLRAVLERAIDALPEEFRVVFMLRAVEEMSGVDTAEVLGIPEDTVKTRLFRARARLRDLVRADLEAQASQVFDFEATRCDRVVRAVFARLGIAETPMTLGKGG